MSWAVLAIRLVLVLTGHGDGFTRYRWVSWPLAAVLLIATVLLIFAGVIRI